MHTPGKVGSVGAHLRLVLVHEPETLERLAMVRRLHRLRLSGAHGPQYATIATGTGHSSHAVTAFEGVKPRITIGALVKRTMATIQFEHLIHSKTRFNKV